MDEKQLNRLVRRVDWRYLLSNPKPEKSICFSDGILKQAIGSVSTLIDVDQAKPGECDLAVAINPTDTNLQSAFDALCSNGEIYTEWYSPFVGGASGVRRRLEKLGFTDIDCYWCWPPPESASPLYWLPLRSRRIFRYYFANRPVSSSIVMRMARFILQMVVSLGLENHVLFPICAIARKAKIDRQESFKESINTEIVRNWQSWGFSQVPSQLTWLLWTPGHRIISKIVAMVFSDVEEKPALVVKIPRSELAMQALASEARNLAILSDRKKSMPKGFPPLLFTLDWNGIPTVGEFFIVGAPIYTCLNRDTYRDLALKVTDWLIELAKGSSPSPRSEWWDRLVGSAMDGFDRSFGPAFTTKELSCIHAVLDNLNNMPLVFEQRDCSPWNILMDDQGHITILDWESAEPDGLPALDLIYFLTYLSFFMEGAMESGNYLDAYRNVFNPDSFTGKINQECAEKYCNQMDMKIGDLQPLRLLTWLTHSRHEYRRLKEDSGGKPTLSVLRGGLFSQLIQEEIRHYNGA